MYNLGVAQAEVGEIDRAVIAYENTLRMRPNCAEAWNNLGVLHREKNNVERAVECYLRAIAINPNFAQALNNVGVVYTIQGLARAALEVLQRSVAATPTYAVAHNNLGVLLRDTGDIPEALEAYRACAALEPNKPQRHAKLSPRAPAHVQPGESEEGVRAHLAWGEAFPPRRSANRSPSASSTPRRTRAPARPSARVGDWWLDRLARFVHPQRVVLCVGAADATATQPRAHDHPPPRRARTRRRRFCARLSRTPAVSGRSVRTTPSDPGGDDSKAGGVDVLVELTGHTANNRLGALALRPAPVQVTWIGYPNTTGMREVDYRLTDAVADPRRRRRPTPSRSCVCPDVSCVTRLAPTRRRWRRAVPHGGLRHLRVF